MPLAALAGEFPAIASAAAADRGAWNRRLAAYRRIAGRAHEAAEHGWFREANDRYHRECAEIAARFGGVEAAASAEARRLRRAAFRRIDRAEKAYWERCTAPMQAAAAALALTPAPDLAALRAKIAVMRAHELGEEDSLARPAFDLLEEDVRRLMEAAAG